MRLWQNQFCLTQDLQVGQVILCQMTPGLEPGWRFNRHCQEWITQNFHPLLHTIGKAPEAIKFSPTFKVWFLLFGGRLTQGRSSFTTSSPTHRVENARRGLGRAFSGAPCMVRMWKTMQSPGWEKKYTLLQKKIRGFSNIFYLLSGRQMKVWL